jgi:hypothetical protein
MQEIAAGTNVGQSSDQQVLRDAAVQMELATLAKPVFSGESSGVKLCLNLYSYMVARNSYRLRF